MSNTSTIYYYYFEGPAYLDLTDPGNMYGYGVVEIETPGGWYAFYEDNEIVRIGPGPETVFVNGDGDFRVSYHVRDCDGPSTAVWATHLGDGTIGPGGADGLPGATGATGPKGAQGNPGPTGEDGVAGATGPAGPSGPVNVVGKAGMRTELVETQSFNRTDWAVMTMFDHVTVSRGGLTADTNTNSLIAGPEGHYELRYGVNAIFNKSQVLYVTPFVNGVQYSDKPLAIRGQGSNKPVELFWVSELDLPVGAIVDLRAYNGGSEEHDDDDDDRISSREEGGGEITIHIIRSVFVLTWDGDTQVAP